MANLQNGQTYYVRARRRGGGIISGWSPAVAFTKQAETWMFWVSGTSSGTDTVTLGVAQYPNTISLPAGNYSYKAFLYYSNHDGAATGGSGSFTLSSALTLTSRYWTCKYRTYNDGEQILSSDHDAWGYRIISDSDSPSLNPSDLLIHVGLDSNRYETEIRLTKTS